MLLSLTRGASQCHNNAFESLKRQLSCKTGRKSLYDLSSELAGRAIDCLEQVRTSNLLPSQLANVSKGSREDSGLCTSDRKMFSIVLRKMCCKHRLLPSSYTITNELERIEGFPCGHGGSADVFCGWYRGSKVAIKRIRRGSNHANVERVRLSVYLRFEMRTC